VIQVSFNLTGLPASLGKQKSRLRSRLRLMINPSIFGGVYFFEQPKAAIAFFSVLWVMLDF
jgi:hypothetical protein